MKEVKALALVGLVGSALMVASGVANAEDISGVIVRTLVLSENTRLVGDVTCNVTAAPCIAFGAPNISLSLNGFTITGQADPTTGCKGTPRRAEMATRSVRRPTSGSDSFRATIIWSRQTPPSVIRTAWWYPLPLPPTASDRTWCDMGRVLSVWTRRPMAGTGAVPDRLGLSDHADTR